MRSFRTRVSARAILGQIGADERASRGVFAAANVLRNAWIGVLRQPGQGRLYSVELRTIRSGGVTRVVPVGSRTPHRASAPGDPPATDTGVSATTIAVDDSKIAQGLTARTGSNKKSLLFLQYGVGPGYGFGPHPAGIVIEPRPHGDIAAAEAEGDMRRAFFDEMQRA